MQTVYPLLRHHKDQTTPYDFARQPDYVVIGLGANDFSTYNNSQYTSPVMTLEEVKKGFSDMFDLVHTKNPNAKIIWVYGWTGSSANAGSTIKEVIAEKGGAQKGYYTLEVEKNTDGANGHSYYTAHTMYANKLSKFIGDLECGFVRGDINGNGEFNLTDVTALAQYVAKWNDTVNVAALDPNGDSEVNLRDVVHLARVQAKWDGVEISTEKFRFNG